MFHFFNGSAIWFFIWYRSGGKSERRVAEWIVFRTGGSFSAGKYRAKFFLTAVCYRRYGWNGRFFLWGNCWMYLWAGDRSVGCTEKNYFTYSCTQCVCGDFCEICRYDWGRWFGRNGIFCRISSFVFTRAFGIFRCVCRGRESTGKSDWLYESFDSLFFTYPLLWRENAEFACLLWSNASYDGAAFDGNEIFFDAGGWNLFFPKRDQSDGRTPVLENGGFNWQYIKDVNSYFVCSNDWLSGNPGLVSSGNGPCEK